ncbi:hypothetical protein [Nocardia sp. NPDC050435]|uniref:hypothetical protein n=1 Tax=Nocardia sp. NPDC050435 TaxID=3155040 RepID=UPI0034022791
MTTPQLPEGRESALAVFTETFDCGSLAFEVGPALTCLEAEALAGLLGALGSAAGADAWIEGHAASDDCGDMHCQCEDCVPEDAGQQ